MDDRLTQVDLTLTALRKALADVDWQIGELEKQSYTQATEHWKEGKYLYLVHPMQNGSRVREYIGADPAKVEWARQRVKRFQIHEDLLARKRLLAQHSRRLEQAIGDVGREAATVAQLL